MARKMGAASFLPRVVEFGSQRRQSMAFADIVPAFAKDLRNATVTNGGMASSASAAPEPLLTLLSSNASFLDAVISDGTDGLYQIETRGTRTHVQRYNKILGLTDVCTIGWPTDTLVNGQWTKSGISVHMAHGRKRAAEDFLKSNPLSSARKFVIPHYGHTLKWKRAGGSYSLTSSASKRVVALLEPAVFSAPPRIRVLEKLYEDETRPQLQHHGIPVLVLDYLIVTAILLVTDREEWMSRASNDAQEPVARRSMDYAAAANYSTDAAMHAQASIQRWRLAVQSEPDLGGPSRATSPAPSSVMTSSAGFGSLVSVTTGSDDSTATTLPAIAPSPLRVAMIPSGLASTSTLPHDFGMSSPTAQAHPFAFGYTESEADSPVLEIANFVGKDDDYYMGSMSKDPTLHEALRRAKSAAKSLVSPSGSRSTTPAPPVPKGLYVPPLPRAAIAAAGGSTENVSLAQTPASASRTRPRRPLPRPPGYPRGVSPVPLPPPPMEKVQAPIVESPVQLPTPVQRADPNAWAVPPTAIRRASELPPLSPATSSFSRASRKSTLRRMASDSLLTPTASPTRTANPMLFVNGLEGPAVRPTRYSYVPPRRGDEPPSPARTASTVSPPDDPIRLSLPQFSPFRIQDFSTADGTETTAPSGSSSSSSLVLPPPLLPSVPRIPPLPRAAPAAITVHPSRLSQELGLYEGMTPGIPPPAYHSIDFSHSEGAYQRSAGTAR